MWFKKQIDQDTLVREIHNEVDQLYINAKGLLALPENSPVRSKAQLMLELGFSSDNETVKKGSNSTSTNIKKLSQYMNRFPLDKIVVWSDFQTLLEKYNLIYAPAKNYIKDVPEKNLLEIKNSKPVDRCDVATIGILKEISFSNSCLQEYKEAFTKLLKKGHYVEGEINAASLVNKHLPEFSTREARGSSYYFNQLVMEKTSMAGLFIAAPLSHFNLKGLKPKNRGFFKTEIIKVNDPIGFNILADEDNLIGFARIITKWGTSDDQSYLDPIVQNEKHN